MTGSLGLSPGPYRSRRSRLRRPAAVLAVVVAVGLAGTSAYLLTTHIEPVAGGTAVEGLLVDGPLTLLPPFAPNQNSTDVGSLLDRGLTRSGADGRAQPELAASWEIDKSSKTFTFHLRPGLQWSDGVPLTSSDALYTLSVLQDASLSQTIQGQAWSGITATAPDAATVVYSLPSSNAAFLSQTGIGLVPEHFLKPRPVASLPMVLDAPTSGPFRYDSSDRNTITLKRNPRALEQPRLDGIQLRRYDSASVALQALMSGEVDMLAQMVPADAQKIGGLPNRRVLRAASFSYVQVLFNQKHDPLGDLGVRQALVRAIDTGGMIGGTMGGFARPIGSPVPPAISWLAAAPGQPGFDAGAAEAGLDNAGWKRPGGQGPRVKESREFALKLLFSDVDPYPALAARVKSDLGRAGTRVDLEQRAEGQLVDALSKGDFDLALLPIDNGPDPDVYPLWHSSQASPAGVNYSGMAKDESLDKALQDGRGSCDADTRKAAYATVEKILTDGAAAVFLYSPDQLIGTTNRLQGVRLNAGMESGARYQFAQEWYVNTRRVR